MKDPSLNGRRFGKGLNPLVGQPFPVFHEAAGPVFPLEHRVIIKEGVSMLLIQAKAQEILYYFYLCGNDLFVFAHDRVLILWRDSNKNGKTLIHAGV